MQEKLGAPVWRSFQKKSWLVQLDLGCPGAVCGPLGTSGARRTLTCTQSLGGGQIHGGGQDENREQLDCFHVVVVALRSDCIQRGTSLSSESARFGD